MRGTMREYSRNVIEFTKDTAAGVCEELESRLCEFSPARRRAVIFRLNKRNDLIHTDAFPSRPTNGDLILRIFTNIHPSKDRSWVVTDPFSVIAERYAMGAGLPKIASGGQLLNQSARLLKASACPSFHGRRMTASCCTFTNTVKRNADFQANCAKYPFDFPPGSTWLTFTDMVPHSVDSGQHALEQTFIVARGSMADPERAPLVVLERLCGKPLQAEPREGQSATR